MVMLLLAGGYVLLKSGKLEELVGGNFKLPELPAIPGLTPQAPSTPTAAPTPSGGRGGRGDEAGEGGSGGGGGAPPSAGAAPPAGGGSASLGAGDCGKTIYAATGQVKDNSKRTKEGTRHYASGKPDDVTQEWGTSVNFKNYEFTMYLTITEVDHDDTASMKFGGTHMGSGWYDNGVGFNSGDFCMGKEENHPSTDLCVVKGKAIGSIVNKKIGVKSIIVGAGTGAAELEMWGDPAGNGQWQLMIPRQKGVGGFFPSSAEQECTIRIDAAPGITMHCSAIQEITGWTKGAGGGAAPAAGGGGGTPSSPAPAPAQTETADEPQPADSGGSGSEDSGGDSESNYTRVNRSYRSRVRYY